MHRRIAPMLCSIALALISAVELRGQIWTGTSNEYINQNGIYGTRGIPDPGNRPGSRLSAVTWVDGSGDLWLFGGWGYSGAGGTVTLNDFWRMGSGGWTWMGGSNTTGNVASNYGTKGIALPTNMPGSRMQSCASTDNAGNLWLFSGNGKDANPGTGGDLNELWKYNIASGMWTWVSGSNLKNQPGIYGTMGVPSPTNQPGSRENATCWMDNANNLWVFGGYGYDSASRTGGLNDLWKYDISNGMWTWMKGSNIVNQGAVYGTKGVPDIQNTPGYNLGLPAWKDNNGDLWLLTVTYLWKYTIATNCWTWIKGPSGSGCAGVYGTQGVPDSMNIPGERNWSAAWKDGTGNFWLFGGSGCGFSPGTGRLNDLWKYDPSSEYWTWVRGSNAVNQPGVWSSVNPSTNTPCGRYKAASWTLPNGNFMLFGGRGSSGYLGDFCIFDFYLFPVEISSINGRWEDSRVHLTWRTATETNNHGFEIQRSIAPAQDRWEIRGFVAGSGSSTSDHDYSFIDEHMAEDEMAGQLSYRLRQIDNDGTSQYSPVIEIFPIVERASIMVNSPYPQPAENMAFVRFTLPVREEISIALYDVLGRDVLELHKQQLYDAGTHTVKVLWNEISPGLYLLRLEGSHVHVATSIIVR